MRVIFHFQPFFQLDLQWPLTSVCDLDLINIWRFPFYIHKPSLVPIGLQLFKGDPKNKFLIFNLSSNLTSDDLWPQYVTLTSSTSEGSHFTSINQVWSQSDFNFSKETQITKTKIFSPNLTSDDPWPWYVTFDLINIWRNPYCIFDRSLVVIGLKLFKGDLNNENLT